MLHWLCEPVKVRLAASSLMQSVDAQDNWPSRKALAESAASTCLEQYETVCRSGCAHCSPSSGTRLLSLSEAEFYELVEALLVERSAAAPAASEAAAARRGQERSGQPAAKRSRVTAAVSPSRALIPCLLGVICISSTA